MGIFNIYTDFDAENKSVGIYLTLMLSEYKSVGIYFILVCNAFIQILMLSGYKSVGNYLILVCNTFIQTRETAAFGGVSLALREWEVPSLSLMFFLIF